MSWSFPRITWPLWSRTKDGENFYDLTALGEWGINGTNLDVAQNHSILTPAILFVAKLFSQAELHVERVSTGKKVDGHELIKFFKNPNRYQTFPDFLETLLFMQIAQGVAIVFCKKIPGFAKPKAMYLLKIDLIKWPEEFEEENFKAFNDKVFKKSIVYDEHGENIVIKIDDLLFLYDLPNGMHKNPFEVRSRLDGLKQTLVNSHDSSIAKNIILKSNGKELISGSKEGFPLTPDEKKDAEDLFNSKYGLTVKGKRGMITKAQLTWKSLHIALRDLGLDESVKIDGNIIYTALHIPKDIISLEAKKTTYNNFKESMVSYIQNEMQATLDSFVAVFQVLLDDTFVLRGSYEHMPIMQFILIERYQGIKGQAEALNALLRTGIPKEIALEMTGFEKTLELTPLMQLENNGQQETSTSRTEQETVE